MNNTELAHIPLNAGQREDIEAKLLPQGLFRRAQNLRLRKVGLMGVRRGFGALGTTDVDGNAVNVFDVASHDGVLIALGSTNTSATGPDSVFTYEPTRARWRPETSHASRTRKLGAMTELREVFRPSFAKTDETLLYDLAYAGGYCALVYEGDAADSLVFVHVFDATTGALLFETTVSARTHPRVCAAGSVFVFAWQDASDDIRCATFNPASATALSAETVVHNTGTVGDGIDLAGISGASEAILFVVRSDTNVGTLYRLNTSLTVLDTATLTQTDIALGSVSAVSAGTTAVAYVRTGGAYGLESFTTSTLNSATGPTALFGGATGSRPPGITRKNATTLVITAALADTLDSQLRVDIRNVTTHVASSALTFREVSAQSKPFVSPDGQYVGVISPYGEGGLVSFAGIFDVENGRGYECARHRGFAVDALPTWLGSVVTDGTRHFAVMVADDLSCAHVPAVVSFKLNSGERRQTAAMNGLLYIAGGFVAVWDGQRAVEAGYFDAPIIVSVTPSNGAGALTPDAEYSWVAHYEWRDAKGNRHQSAVSDPVLATMGASDDTAAVVVTTQHSVRRVVGSDTGGKVVLSRTEAFPDRFHRRAGQAFSSSAFAACITINDLASDDEIHTQEIVYTQGARGSLSGPLQHDAPVSSDYIWPTRERILNAGHPVRSNWQQSKRAFPEEPVNWSGFPGFLGAVGSEVTAVASQDDIDFVFTRDQTFIIGGSGPDDNGNGEFAPPRELPGDQVGCDDWRSLVATSKGLWLKDREDRLQIIPRGGGAAEWLGQPVRDTLEAYPVITSANVVSLDNCACWTARNALGTEGVIIAHDLRSGDWFVDTLPEFSNAPIQAACEHEGRLVVVVGNDVYLQDAGFDAQATVEIEGFISYDDGVTFSAMGDDAFSVSGAAGSTYSVQWWPARRKGDRYVLRFDVTSATVGAIPYSFTTGTIAPWGTEGWGKLVSVTLTSEVASEGLLFSNLTLETAAAKKPSRKSASQRK